MIAGIIALPSNIAAADTTTTSAATTGCPTPPPAYTGTDTTIAALTSAQQDADQSCAAITTAVDSSGQRAGAQVSSALAQPLTVTQTAPLTVTQTGTSATGTVAVSNFPADQQVSADDSTRSFIDSEGNGINIDIWILIGSVVGLLALGTLLQRIWP